MWTCLVWAERSTPDNFSDSIPPQVSRTESLRPFILTPSRPVGCLTHWWQAPTWEAQTSHFYVFGVTRSGIEPRPPAPRADALTTMLRGGGPFSLVWDYVEGKFSNDISTESTCTRQINRLTPKNPVYSSPYKSYWKHCEISKLTLIWIFFSLGTI